MGTGNQHTDTHSLRILFFFLFQEFVIIMFFMKKIKLFLTTFLLAAMDIHSLHVHHHGSCWSQCSAFLTFFGGADWCWSRSDSGDYIKCETHVDCTREKAYEKKYKGPCSG